MKALSDKYHKIWLDNEDLTDDYGQIMEEIRYATLDVMYSTYTY